ncbi:MAG: DUF2156 domain-containing protein [Erysipelotrichales bacterium]|nr:DUF2156 domain-containing protein [Erysipelotrichales bacterium]
MFTDGLLFGFKRLTIQDYPLVQKYYEMADLQESNHNIINLFMWNKIYPVWFREGDGWLILVGYHKGEWFLYMPLCSCGCVIEAIRTGEELFASKGLPYVLSCYTREVMEKVLAIDPSFHVEAIRAGYDYIYEFEKLATFSGKKLQKKRNHINSFMNEYAGRYEYKRMGLEDIEDCLKFLEEWKECEEDTFLQQECQGASFVLKHFQELPYIGAVVRIDGVVKGFTIGSRLNHDTVQINVEKADKEIRGLYPFLTREYLVREWSDQGIKWVDREDDMGKENIRKAKESLQPAYLVEKYRIFK